MIRLPRQHDHDGDGWPTNPLSIRALGLASTHKGLRQRQRRTGTVQVKRERQETILARSELLSWRNPAERDQELGKMVGKGNTVRLISAEGFEFVIDYEAACVSNTIKNMLSSKGEMHTGSW